jgi:phage shock protein B
MFVGSTIVPLAALALPVVIVALIMSPIIILAIVLAKRGKGGNDEELRRFVQEFHKDMERMEKRVESLETLLLQTQGKDETSI